MSSRARLPRRKARRSAGIGSRCPSLAFAIAAPILAARGLTPLSRIGAGALVARLVHRMNAEGRLSHYQSVATTPGFPRAVAGVIAELRLARISLDAIGACAPDLEPLVEAYEIELKEAGLTDWPGVLALASEAASAVGGNRPRLIGLPMLLLDVPIRNEAEFVFVDSLTAAATEVLATVPTADQATLRRLRDRLRAQIEDLDQGSVGDESGASIDERERSHEPPAPTFQGGREINRSEAGRHG